MKMPTIVVIFIFISREIFMLSWVEHEKKIMPLGPGHCLLCVLHVTDMLSKQLRPSSDATFFGVWTGFTLFANSSSTFQNIISLTSSLIINLLTVVARVVSSTSIFFILFYFYFFFFFFFFFIYLFILFFFFFLLFFFSCYRVLFLFPHSAYVLDIC